MRGRALGKRVQARWSRAAAGPISPATRSRRCAPPTLLIVGGDDHEVITLNAAALARLTAPKALEIVPGATHLFSEPGALDAVVDKAAAWFVEHLGAAAR